jgi:chorismate mutase
MYKGILIAGACSVESREQIQEIATQLSSFEIDFLRGGIWKPRTKPNTFEGMGAQALAFLKSAGDSIEKKVCTEVANKNHVYLANKAGIDAYWIGARTSGNPFALKEIISEVQKNKKLVFVKNPICGNFDLWAGALERFIENDIEVIAINRGMTSEFSYYRNIPLWEQSLKIKEKFKIKVITDPSHIAGERSKLKEIIDISQALNFDGLMIEVHNNPEIALTDSKQQVQADELRKLLYPISNKFNALRMGIDVFDKAIISILQQRFELCKEIGNKKRMNQSPIEDLSRENEVIKKLQKFYPESNFIESIMKSIFEHSKKIQ